MNDTERPLNKAQSHRCYQFPCDGVPRYKIGRRCYTYLQAYEEISRREGVSWRDDKDPETGTPIKTRILAKGAFDRLGRLNDHYKIAAEDFIIAKQKEEQAKMEAVLLDMKATLEKANAEETAK